MRKLYLLGVPLSIVTIIPLCTVMAAKMNSFYLHMGLSRLDSDFVSGITGPFCGIVSVIIVSALCIDSALKD